MSASQENRSHRWWENGSLSAALLILLVIGSSFASDKWIPNAQLSLPLLIATLLAFLTAAVGISRLRALKMGQVIREEGHKAIEAKPGPQRWGDCSSSLVEPSSAAS